MTQSGKACARVDVSNALHSESAAAAGVDLLRLLWVRCGIPASCNASLSPANGFALPEKYLAPPPVKKGLHGGRFGAAAVLGFGVLVLRLAVPESPRWFMLRGRDPTAKYRKPGSC